MSSPPSSSESEAFGKLDERIQRWIWQAGWTELKDVQEQSIPAILSGDRDVVIAAATASGKTEAAFFPILTRMLSASGPTSAIYISPLKALINDQWGRLSGLCSDLEIPVYPWHGDISQSLKLKFQRRPHGCLLITPESLEGLLMRDGHALERLFGGLLYVVIDELHAFIDSDRGKQLQSLLNRIDVALERRVPRIGLSATLGKMELAADFLRPDDGAGASIVNSRGAGQELKVLVRGITNDPPRLSDEEAAENERSGIAVRPEDLVPQGVLAIKHYLFETLRGSNNLVFPNSRNRVEMYADLLRRTCEDAGIPNEFWPHHGSLSKSVREETESSLKSGERPATAIATTTLELGIDIGAVKSIAQIGPAPSVASLRQRLGRSGRRRGEPAILRAYSLEEPPAPDMAIADRLREGLLQTVAQVRLLMGSWFEPPRIESMHLSTLVQQLLSLIAQYGGITATRAWDVLCTSGVFPGITRNQFVGLLRELGRREVLIQDATGLLLHGPVGERIVNHYSFLAAFPNREEFRIVANGRELGTLPIDRPISAGSFLIFAGRRWAVVGCYPEEKLIEVTPSKAGKVPMFDGGGGKVHDRVREEMRAILAEDSSLGFVDANGTRMLEEARDCYRDLHLENDVLVRDGDDVLVFTWRGDWVNDTLAMMLGAQGLAATNEGMSIQVIDAHLGRVEQALDAIASGDHPDGTELVRHVRNKFRGKYDGFLPDDLLDENFASSELDIGGAIEWAKGAPGIPAYSSR
jgi:ATP-dependent Lhr-like helicase